MLEEWKFDWKKLDEAECKVRLKARRLDLAGLQQPIKGAGLPVIVLIEGWGASGKGSMLPHPGAGPSGVSGAQRDHAHPGGAALALPQAPL